MEINLIAWCKVFLLHHCKKHKEHDPACLKCKWWTKAGKCQKRKPLDANRLYDSTVIYYMNGYDGNDQEAIAKANKMAQDIVAQAMEREKEFMA